MTFCNKPVGASDRKVWKWDGEVQNPGIPLQSPPTPPQRLLSLPSPTTVAHFLTHGPRPLNLFCTTTYSVIANITRGGSQVYNGGRLGTAYTKCMHVCHDIMSSLLLLRSRKLVIYIRQVSFHFLYLFICDIQSQHLQIKIGQLCLYQRV